MPRAELAMHVKTDEPDHDSWVKLFRLEAPLSTNNMHAFNAQGKLVKYETSDAILRAFYDVRRYLYAKRKHHLEHVQTKELLRLTNRIRFILEVSSGTLQTLLHARLPKTQLVALLLKAHELTPASAFQDETMDRTAATGGTPATGNEDPRDEFYYLLNMSLVSFTKEVSDRLQTEHDTKQRRLHHLQAMTPAQMWRAKLERPSYVMTNLDTIESRNHYDYYTESFA
ncbi:hypothetical protein PsorP6_012869 [Peronosclerospora sorghi]|uniref:Uncharacterized protein n=1 Tax=Peronosclerospora sorghi TaxID=230839 RepID=A0ACC0WGV2_9STRA|nr:hypothetical protein PsorP6_012869 [Peronosclerospora sorghi]